MKNKKLLVMTLVMVFSAMLLLSACGGSTTPPASSKPASSSPASSSAAQSSASSGKAIVINFGHGGSTETAQQVGALALKKHIETQSGGRLVVNVYPSNQIGNDRELCEAVQAGNQQACLANSVQVNFVPDATIYDLYFRFQTIEDAIKKFRNDQNFFKTMSAKYEKSGYHLLGFSVHGFRQITANKPIRKPADLGGLTFRTQENKYHIIAFKSMGASPTPFAFNELYTALQQGTVNAQENPIELIYSQKFYEQQKYITMSNHQQQVQTWLMSKKFYDSLPDDLKKIVDEGAVVACNAAQEYAISKEGTWKKAITDYGVKIVELTTEEYNTFKNSVGPEWDAIKAAVSPEVWDAYVK